MIHWRIGSFVMYKFQNEPKLWFMSSFVVFVLAHEQAIIEMKNIMVKSQQWCQRICYSTKRKICMEHHDICAKIVRSTEPKRMLWTHQMLQTGQKQTRDLAMSNWGGVCLSFLRWFERLVLTEEEGTTCWKFPTLPSLKNHNYQQTMFIPCSIHTPHHCCKAFCTPQLWTRRPRHSLCFP